MISILDDRVREWTTRPPEHLEHYQLLHYEIDQGYGLHHDFIKPQAALAGGQILTPTL